MPFICNAVLTARAGSEELVQRVLVQLAEASRLEKGNRSYEVVRDPTATSVFLAFEVYDDERAFEAHLSSPHFGTAFETAGALLESRSRSTFESLEHA